MNRASLKIGPVDGAYFDNHPDYVAAMTAKEREAFRVFREFLHDHAELLHYVARQGDGEGGQLVSVMKEVLFGPPVPIEPKYRKEKISASLRTAVFERDLYRCVRCGTHVALCADHIHPESLGGSTTLDNLQTLCKPCNSSKGCKVQEVTQ